MGKYEWVGNDPKFIEGQSGKMAHISKDNCIRFESPINVLKDEFTIVMCARTYMDRNNKMIAVCNLSDDFISTINEDDESSSTLFFIIFEKGEDYYLYGGVGNGTSSNKFITKRVIISNILKINDINKLKDAPFVCFLIESSNEVVNVYVNNEKVITLDYKNEKDIPRVPRKYMSFGDSKFVQKYTDEKGIIEIDNIRLYDKILDEDTKKCIAKTFCGVDSKKIQKVECSNDYYIFEKDNKPEKMKIEGGLQVLNEDGVCVLDFTDEENSSGHFRRASYQNLDNMANRVYEIDFYGENFSRTNDMISIATRNSDNAILIGFCNNGKEIYLGHLKHIVFKEQLNHNKWYHLKVDFGNRKLFLNDDEYKMSGEQVENNNENYLMLGIDQDKVGGGFETKSGNKFYGKLKNFKTYISTEKKKVDEINSKTFKVWYKDEPLFLITEFYESVDNKNENYFEKNIKVLTNRQNIIDAYNEVVNYYPNCNKNRQLADLDKDDTMSKSCKNRRHNKTFYIKHTGVDYCSAEGRSWDPFKKIYVVGNNLVLDHWKCDNCGSSNSDCRDSDLTSRKILIENAYKDIWYEEIKE